jgi:hypothetical protein
VVVDVAVVVVVLVVVDVAVVVVVLVVVDGIVLFSIKNENFKN